MAKKKNKNKKKMGWRGQILMLSGIMTAAVFLPSTVLLLIGMIPTPFALLTDRTRGKNKVITVGAMNVAGCSPFLFELWTTDHSFVQTMAIVTDPFAIVVMWSSAAVGYIINWAMTGLVTATLYQRGQSRQKAIQKRQQELVERWGQEVTGNLPLDPQGFPVDQGQATPTKNKSDP
ncbi:MAG: hypothetical protein CMH27_04230 [Micavibrio sp.]|nr:hypothetical protein [Micavibrio sp.]|tara:strand:- start:490 stop:1017 length:528 start_codon:yes stop_codon:yes gene_type:complete